MEFILKAFLEGLKDVVVSNSVITQQCLNPTWLVQGHTYIQKRQTVREHISGPSHAYPMDLAAAEVFDPHQVT